MNENRLDLLSLPDADDHELREHCQTLAALHLVSIPADTSPGEVHAFLKQQVANGFGSDLLSELEEEAIDMHRLDGKSATITQTLSDIDDYAERLFQLFRSTRGPERQPAVTLEIKGGNVIDVRGSAPVEVIVLDRDVEGSDPADLVEFPGQKDGALIRPEVWEARVDLPFVAKAHDVATGESLIEEFERPDPLPRRKRA